MEAKFNLEFSYLVARKKLIHTPSSATYDSILAAFAKRRNGEKLDKNSEQNFVSRYRLVESNGVEKLYRGHQEVVKQEEGNSAAICVLMRSVRVKESQGKERARGQTDQIEFQFSIIKFLNFEFSIIKLRIKVEFSIVKLQFQDILIMHLRQEKSTSWASALHVVQAAKNARWHRGIGRSPYEAMFGRKMMLGYEDDEALEFEQTLVDDQALDTDESDEYVPIDGSNWIALAETDEPLHKSNSASPSQSKSPSSERSQSPSALNNTIARLQQFPQRERQILFEVENEEPSFSDAINEENQLNQLHFQREAEREGARAQQKRQAQQMLDGSAKRFPPIPVGQTVRVPVPAVDRAKTDPRNMLGVVMAADDGFYSIGTGVGILKDKYTRNQIDPCSSQHVTMESVPDKEISLRSAVGADSLSGTQGPVHCSCFRGCTTGKCKCKSLERLCNSRCHNSTTCKNK